MLFFWHIEIKVCLCKKIITKTKNRNTMRNTQTNKLETGLTCKIDHNGRIHVFKTKETKPEPKVKEGLYLALFFIALTIFILIKTN